MRMLKVSMEVGGGCVLLTDAGHSDVVLRIGR